jgi:hypothetical protein
MNKINATCNQLIDYMVYSLIVNTLDLYGQPRLTCKNHRKNLKKNKVQFSINSMLNDKLVKK